MNNKCGTCIYCERRFCSCKGDYIENIDNEEIEDCWSYRDSITLSSEFADELYTCNDNCEDCDYADCEFRNID